MHGCPPARAGQPCMITAEVGAGPNKPAESQIRAPTAWPLRGRRKVELGMPPPLNRGPVMIEASVLSRAAAFHVPPRSQELALPVEEAPSATALALSTARFPVSTDFE